jgi:hypothetical protein
VILIHKHVDCFWHYMGYMVNPPILLAIWMGCPSYVRCDGLGKEY